MAFNVIITEPAAEDIDQAFTFIKSHSASASVAWLYAVQQAIESLESMPYRGARIAENTGHGFEYRHLVYRNHRIVFRVDETSQQVFVVRVYHSSRIPLQTDDLP